MTCGAWSCEDPEPVDPEKFAVVAGVQMHPECAEREGEDPVFPEA